MGSPRRHNPHGISRGAFHKEPKVTALIKRKACHPCGICRKFITPACLVCSTEDTIDPNIASFCKSLSVAIRLK